MDMFRDKKPKLPEAQDNLENTEDIKAFEKAKQESKLESFISGHFKAKERSDQRRQESDAKKDKKPDLAGLSVDEKIAKFKKDNFKAKKEDPPTKTEEADNARRENAKRIQDLRDKENQAKKPAPDNQPKVELERKVNGITEKILVDVDTALRLAAGNAAMLSELKLDLQVAADSGASEEYTTVPGGIGLRDTRNDTRRDQELNFHSYISADLTHIDVLAGKVYFNGVLDTSVSAPGSTAVSAETYGYIQYTKSGGGSTLVIASSLAATDATYFIFPLFRYGWDGANSCIDTSDIEIYHEGNVYIWQAPEDYRVMVSSNDTTPGYLEDKIVSASSSLLVATIGDPGDEDVQLTIDESAFTHTHAITSLTAGTSTTGQIIYNNSGSIVGGDPATVLAGIWWKLGNTTPAEAYGGVIGRTNAITAINLTSMTLNSAHTTASLNWQTLQMIGAWTATTSITSPSHIIDANNLWTTGSLDVLNGTITAQHLYFVTANNHWSTTELKAELAGAISLSGSTFTGVGATALLRGAAGIATVQADTNVVLTYGSNIIINGTTFSMQAAGSVGPSKMLLAEV